MDLVSNCKEKLVNLRVKDLKKILTQLGLSKQGKKQDLIDRILAILSDEQVSKIWPKKTAARKEEVANLVDETYRKMQISEATDLALMRFISDGSNGKLKEEIDDPFKKICCPCGISLETEPIVQCDDSRCHRWQHIGCVVVPEKPMDGLLQIPDPFYCDICRLSRADPFWVTIAHSLNPVKLIATSVPTDGTSPLQIVERTFQLTRADKDLLSRNEYDVQVWCILLNDKVPFRIQWPQYADLQVNGLPVRVINRPGSQLLGANGRDDGPIITQCTREGNNKITLKGCDARIFCMGVRIAKRRTVQQVLNLIPKELDGEHFEDALARVCRCIGGGATTDNADSDSDLEVVADSFTVNLRCPMSGSRIKVSGRFKPCVHMGCFDLDTFVELNQRSRKWQCPICLKNYSLANVIIDPYFNRITSMMGDCGEDVTEIEVKADGSWRPKPGSVSGELGQWHFSNGDLCNSTTDVEAKQKMEVLNQIDQEGASEAHIGGLKLGIKNCNGFWEINKPEGNNVSSGNMLPDGFQSNSQKVIPMNSSATDSFWDGEDTSVNHDGDTKFDFFANSNRFGFVDQNPSVPVGDTEVIVLSDSEEEDVIVSSRTIYNNHPVNSDRIIYPAPTGVCESYSLDPSVDLGGNSCLGLLNSNADQFGSLWTLPPSAETGPEFEFFGSDADVTNPLVDLEHCSINCSTSLHGYTLIPEITLESSVRVPNAAISISNPDINGDLVNNSLTLGEDDPSLQIFLPTRSSDVSIQPYLTVQTDMSNSIPSDDWISLTLGGSSSGGHHDSNATGGLNSRKQSLPNGASINYLSDTASLVVGMNDGRSEKSRQWSDRPFLFPRQRRSVRPRLNLNSESASEEW